MAALSLGVSDSLIGFCCRNQISNIKGKILVYEKDYITYNSIKLKLYKDIKPQFKYVKIFKNSLKDLINSNNLSSYDMAFLFTFQVYLNENNDIFIDKKYPTKEVMMKLLNVKKSKLYEILGNLESLNIITRRSEGKYSIVHFNEEYISNEKIKEND